MGQEEKIGLVHRIGRRDIKLGPRDVVGPGEVNLLQRLFGQPSFCHIFRDLGGGSQLFDGGHPFPVPLRAVVDLRESGVHACNTLACILLVRLHTFTRSERRHIQGPGCWRQ